jgi:hypothetical protein
MKMDLVDDGMEPEDAQDKACEKYDCDPAMYDKYVEMKRDEREGSKNESLEEADDDTQEGIESMNESEENIEVVEPETAQTEPVEETAPVEGDAELQKIRDMAGIGSNAKSNFGIRPGEEGYQTTPRSIIQRQRQALDRIANMEPEATQEAN